MNVYTCIDHDGRWPVGVASVVVARDEAEARKLLAEALIKIGLKGDDFTLQLLDLSKPNAVVLNNGDY
jgi:hypothetical protein